mmetsp:Transcript_38787/g.124331  ORF Transcript_38787/g.124331 Transcript_38787/m.124331 type:complete len:390 (+) Transcript_38787:266-1435(+)
MAAACPRKEGRRLQGGGRRVVGVGEEDVVRQVRASVGRVDEPVSVVDHRVFAVGPRAAAGLRVADDGVLHGGPRVADAEHGHHADAKGLCESGVEARSGGSEFLPLLRLHALAGVRPGEGLWLGRGPRGGLGARVRRERRPGVELVYVDRQGERGPVGPRDDGDDHRRHLRDALHLQAGPRNRGARGRSGNRLLHGPGRPGPHRPRDARERHSPEDRRQNQARDAPRRRFIDLPPRRVLRRPGRRPDPRRGPRPTNTRPPPPPPRRHHRLLDLTLPRLRRSHRADHGHRNIHEVLRLWLPPREAPLRRARRSRPVGRLRRLDGPHRLNPRRHLALHTRQGRRRTKTQKGRLVLSRSETKTKKRTNSRKISRQQQHHQRRVRGVLSCVVL